MNDLETAKKDIESNILRMIVIEMLVKQSVKDGKHPTEMFDTLKERITAALLKNEQLASSQDALTVKELYFQTLGKLFAEVSLRAEAAGIAPLQSE